MADDCTNADAANDALTLALRGPAEVRGDAGAVRQHSLADLIKAEQYQAGKCAATATGLGLRKRKLTPGDLG